VLATGQFIHSENRFLKAKELVKMIGKASMAEDLGAAEAPAAHCRK